MRADGDFSSSAASGVLNTCILRRHTRNRFEYTAQGTHPGPDRFIDRNRSIAVREYAVIGHLADNRIGAGEFSDLLLRHLQNHIAEIRAEQITRIHAVLDFYTQLIAESHLRHGCRNT